MKTYKQLFEGVVHNLLSESEYAPGHFQSDTMIGSKNTTAASDMGSYRVELDEIVGRINAFIKEFTEREYIDPTNLRNNLKARLNHYGLDFECNVKERVTEGSYVYKLNRFGGSFGTTPEHDLLKDGFKTSDMIAEFAGTSMVLEFIVVKNDSSMYEIEARMKPE